MRAPYTTNQPHLNGVVAVSIDGQIKCAAVLITARLALSVASCFLLPGTLPLSEAQQIACLQGTCEPNTVVSPSSVRLLGGNDARVREVAARVHRIAIRFTQPWAIPICTRALCGEGWDVALLEIDPSCAHGPLACLPPIPLSSVPAAIGLTPTAVGFGSNPSFDQRAEWDLRLATNGSGVRRVAPARVWRVASRQRMSAEATGDVGPAAAAAAAAGLRLGPFCVGDMGAALLSERNGVWELDGLHVPASSPVWSSGGTACDIPQGDAWSTHASRCWIEDAARRWRLPPVVEAYRDECGTLDFHPPELDFHYLGGGGALGATYDESGQLVEDDGLVVPGGVGGNCSVISCEMGVCIAGQCNCAGNFFGPRCTLRGPPPTFFTYLDSITVSPNGVDDDSCGGLRNPCRTLRQALARQYWQYYGGFSSGTTWELYGTDPPPSGYPLVNEALTNGLQRKTVFTLSELASFGLADGVRTDSYIASQPLGDIVPSYFRPLSKGVASITLLDGTYSGEGNVNLVLTGMDVQIRGLRGPDHVLIDCRQSLDGAHDYLFLRGEHPGCVVSGLTLRKCLVDAQVQATLSAHPQYFAHVAGPERWPEGRRGATFRGVRWSSSV